jgi:hypothetical protein
VNDVLTYVYCLVRGSRRPALRAVPAGMPASRGLRALDAGAKLWAIVTTVPAAEYGDEGLANGLQDLEWVGSRAVAHESVVEHFLAAGTVLPMQLFTLFTSDARALDHVARDRARIDRIVERVDGRLEWGLRLSFDPKAAQRARPQPAPSPRRSGDSSGASYLAAKRDVLQASRLQLTEARTEADRLYAVLSREAAEARRRTAIEQAVPNSRVVLDAAFLVPATRGSAFKKAVRHETRRLAGSGVDVSLTGPWPAYNFIDTPPDAAGGSRKRGTPRTGGSQPRVARTASARVTAKRRGRGRI